MTVLATDIPWAGEDAREQRVFTAMEAEWARREARRRLDTEERGPVTLPAFETLRTRLARPVTAPQWRVEGMQPRNSRVMLAAQFKAGKTTLRDNYVRALLDGDLFLGRYDVEQVTAGKVLVLDVEMSGHQLDAWLRAQRIQNDDRLIVLAMRGLASTFNPLDDDNRKQWAAQIRAAGVEVLVLDCLRPVMDALALDEHSEAGRFLVAFDALLAEAGVSEALVIHHMGHTNERARGDSRLRDWPDVEWRLVRRDDDPSSARFLTAYGRDVDQPESELLYDPLTRHLTISDGSRRDASSRDALGAVVAVLADGPMSGRAIIQAVMESGEHAKHAIEGALKHGVGTNELTFDFGPRRAKLYRVPQCPGVPRDLDRGSSAQCPAPYKGGALGHSETGPFVFDPTKAYIREAR